MWSSRPYTFDRVVRIFFSAVVFCIVLYFVYILRHVLLPFCVACLIAYLIEPWVRWNQKTLKIKKHNIAAILTTFEAASIFMILCFVLIPIIEKEFSQLAQLMDNYMKSGHLTLTFFPTNFHEFISTRLDVDRIISTLEKVNSTQAWDWIWQSLTSGLDKILGVLGWVISIVYVIFILLDFDKYKSTFRKCIPEKYKPVVSSIVDDTSWTMKKYFRNQAFISLIVGICYAVGFSIVGIPMAVVIGLINIILFMVPYLVYISLIPVTVMCMFKSMEGGVDFWSLWFECLAVYAIVEIFSDIILTPHVMGKALGLNPAIILLSLSVWGTLLGLLGMVIALPATTIMTKWAKILISQWKANVDSRIDTVSSPPPDCET